MANSQKIEIIIYSSHGTTLYKKVLRWVIKNIYFSMPCKNRNLFLKIVVYSKGVQNNPCRQGHRSPWLKNWQDVIVWIIFTELWICQVVLETNWISSVNALQRINPYVLNKIDKWWIQCDKFASVWFRAFCGLLTQTRCFHLFSALGRWGVQMTNSNVILKRGHQTLHIHCNCIRQDF